MLKGDEEVLTEMKIPNVFTYDRDWRIKAACRAPGVDLSWFFPVSNAGPSLADIASAKAVCAECPVRAQCLAWSLAVGVPFGVLGGLDEWERDALIRRMRTSKTVAA
jgi:WhiB family redox-sensing transcriptional regulator